MDSVGSLAEGIFLFFTISLLAPTGMLSLCFPLTLFHLNRIAASLKLVQIQAQISKGFWYIQEAGLSRKYTLIRKMYNSEIQSRFETCIFLLNIFCCWTFLE